jgi:hypothetical protein
MTYLAEAATEIARAFDANGRHEEATRNLPEDGPARAAVRAERLAITDRLIAIAAIEAGVTTGAGSRT